jgi:hypothetical protein
MLCNSSNDFEVLLREDMGGHHLYSTFQCLLEALEVVFGDNEFRSMIEGKKKRRG